MSRLIGIIAIFVFVFLLILTAAVFGPGAAGADTSPSPSPSPSVTADPAPEQATAAQVAKALKMRGKAKAQRQSLARVRACFDARGPVRLYPTPKTRTAEAWQKALRRWTHQRDDWQAKVKAGRKEMRSPHGAASGKKWLPLAKWVGWPKRALHTLAGLIWYESSGIKANISPTNDWGLTQLNRPSWEAKFRQVMHAAWSKTLNPEYNLRFALWIWKSQGGKFKPAWARDKAVEAVE